MMNPAYPIYIVSKGRWEQKITQRALQEINLPYTVIVEEEEIDLYKKHDNYGNFEVLPPHYKTEYDTFDDLGLTKSTGPGPARNFAWDLAIQNGYDYHWVMDDNCQHFFRLNRNAKIRLGDGTLIRVIEDFVKRYKNLPLAGINYHGLCKSVDPVPPYVLNTRIYSFLFIRNDCRHRWRGRYNEDTDLSLRVLKDGDCTMQFNALLAEKIMTQRVKGGNTGEFYDDEGTKAKSQMLEDMHPDVARVVWKFNRWHHQVDYKRFKNNRLLFRDDYIIKYGVNEYGMKLKRRREYEDN
jgi:hypothetical protein